MTEEKTFSVDLTRVRRAEKPRPALDRLDDVGEANGFVSREPVRRGGRKRSPRTAQVHTRVLPHVGQGIADEARRRGTQQGVILEEAWALYVEKHAPPDDRSPTPTTDRSQIREAMATDSRI